MSCQQIKLIIGIHSQISHQSQATKGGKKWTNQVSSKFKCHVHQRTVLQGIKETHRMVKICANFKIIPIISKDLLELKNNQKNNNSI